MNPQDLPLLRCPGCGAGGLTFSGRLLSGQLHHGILRCPGCASGWPVADGLPRLYEEGRVGWADRMMRLLYDGFPALHNPAVDLLLPLMQGSSSADLREHYLARLELHRLAAPPGGGPARVLEVGFGAGANLPLLRRDLPPGLEVEIWGMDLSRGMLRRGQALARRGDVGPAKLLLADAHAIPLPDHAFDRVFHVGAMGSFSDPARALAEMARVARPGTPIVVVDEQLDPGRPAGLLRRAAFRALTFYDANPHSPRELLPPGATGVLDEQPSRFYYCLTFRCE